MSFDINSLLDGTLDDLKDLPEFKPFPAGIHKVILKLEQKKIGEHPSFEVQMTYVEAIELKDTSEAAPVAGSKSSVAYLLDNDFGQGQFKNLLKAAAEKFGQKSNRELVADLQGAEVLVTTGTREDKKTPGKFHQTIIEMGVL